MTKTDSRPPMTTIWVPASILIAFLPMILMGVGVLDESVWIFLWLQVAIGIVFVQLFAALQREWPETSFREIVAFCVGTIGGTLWVLLSIYLDLFWLPRYVAGVKALSDKFFGGLPGVTPALAPPAEIATNPNLVLAFIVPSLAAIVIVVLFIYAMRTDKRFGVRIPVPWHKEKPVEMTTSPSRQDNQQ